MKTQNHSRQRIVAFIIFMICLVSYISIVKSTRANTSSLSPLKYEVFDANTHRWSMVRVQDIQENTVIRIWETSNTLMNYQGCVYFLIDKDSYMDDDGNWLISIIDCAESFQMQVW